MVFLLIAKLSFKLISALVIDKLEIHDVNILDLLVRYACKSPKCPTSKLTVESNLQKKLMKKLRQAKRGCI